MGHFHHLVAYALEASEGSRLPGEFHSLWCDGESLGLTLILQYHHIGDEETKMLGVRYAELQCQRGTAKVEELLVRSVTSL
jgi:hypothetical protein